ncbi:hypothetical protein [Streptomyces sp. G45]|uniref:hypothetical protein n=1 Tax=Streptomyces sp. G45 TaxID=3406627 RepID=UPI003C1946C0
MHPRPALNPRLLALLGVVAVAALVPLAGAAAGPVLGDAERAADPRAAARGTAGSTGTAGATGAAGTTDDRNSGGSEGTAAEGTASEGAASGEAVSGGGVSEEGASEGGVSEGSVSEGAADGRAGSRSGAHHPSRPQDTTAHCGPELSSPEGVEAQTCVLTQGKLTWARTYYRNATGEALDAVLSAMGPKGRTVQMHCAVGADDEPGACDTPRERTAGPVAHYTAVAEFARGSGGALLLRSGSNSSAARGS